MTAFTDRLSAELEYQRLSMRKLGDRSGFSATQVSDVLSEKAPASAEFVISTAYALGLDPVEMLRISRHLRPAPPVTDYSQLICSAFRSLSEPLQAAVGQIVLRLAGVGQGAENAPAAASPSRSSPALEEDAYRALILDPAAPTLHGDQHDSELDQALEDLLRWLWDRFPPEERASRFSQAAIEFAFRMESQNQT